MVNYPFGFFDAKKVISFTQCQVYIPNYQSWGVI